MHSQNFKALDFRRPSTKKHYLYNLDTKQILSMLAFAKEMLDVPRHEMERLARVALSEDSAVHLIAKKDERQVNLSKLFGESSQKNRIVRESNLNQSKIRNFKDTQRYSMIERQSLQIFSAGNQEMRELIAYVDYRLFERSQSNNSVSKSQERDVPR